MPRFQPGDPVINIANAGESGIVVRLAHRHADQDWYRVRFGNVERTVIDGSLAPIGQAPTLEDRVTKARAMPASLRRAVTARKIALGMRDLVYSLGATKTKQYPYQFKPLLKLLQSSARRILVADEVGLGKTIEAGYVVMETIARNPGARVVIVCPAGLRTKWKSELINRFGLRFDILDRPTAIRRIATGVDGADDPVLRAIVSYETIRGDEFLTAINEEEGPALLVVDEAHRTRHASTATAESVHRLAAASDWVVYLTATPIQTSDGDLFTLLGALNPDEFPSLEAFRDRARLNRHVVAAEVALQRPGVAGLREARKALEDVRSEEGAAILTASPYYKEATDAIDRAIGEDGALADDQRVARRVELQARLFEINLLSPYYTRTRRRHVHTEFAERQVATVTRDMTPYEKEVNDRLLQAIYAEYRREHGAGIARLVLVSYQMQLASSLAGAVRNIKSQIGARFAAEEDELETVEALAREVAPEGDAETPQLQSVAKALEGVDIERLEQDDSKWRALDEILSNSANEARLRGLLPPKAIVFSFYRASLNVIERKLRDAGIGFRRIDGSVPHDPMNEERDEKGRRIREFRDLPEVRILLASQVGSEGLDLQFADTVVNWDLPWNPMAVEQRIGRVDRLGQQSPVVKAFSIVLRGTVEERIVARLYDRLRVFQEHIGECEQVLGDQLVQIHRDLFKQALTPEQIELRVQQAQQAIETNRLLGRELEKTMDALVGQEQFLIDRVAELKRTGRYISPEELENFVLERLKDVDPTSTMARRPDGITWDFRAGPGFRQVADAARGRNDREWREFIDAIRNRPIALTFVAEDRKGTAGPILVHAMHPFVKTLVHQLRVGIEEEVAAFEAAVSTERIPAGTYLVAISSVTDGSKTIGASILASAVPVEGGDPLEHSLADELLNEVVVRGGAGGLAVDPGAAAVRAAYLRAEERLDLRLAEHAQSVTTAERSRRTRLRQTIDREAEREISRIHALIAEIEGTPGSADSGKRRQILPIYRARADRIEATRQRRVEEMASFREPDLSGAVFAAGLVTVTGKAMGESCRESHTSGSTSEAR